MSLNSSLPPCVELESSGRSGSCSTNRRSRGTLPARYVPLFGCHIRQQACWRSRCLYPVPNTGHSRTDLDHAASSSLRYLSCIFKLSFETPTIDMSTAITSVALLGTGLYAQSDYIPALSSEVAKNVKVHTIWSLDETAAKLCASKLRSNGIEPRVLAKPDDIEMILQDKGIDAIIMVLPFMYQGDIIRRAWKAGKHVLSEKPIERDVEAAMSLVKEYQEVWAPQGLVWRVAEGMCVYPCPPQSARIARKHTKRKTPSSFSKQKSALDTTALTSFLDRLRP